MTIINSAQIGHSVLFPHKIVQRSYRNVIFAKARLGQDSLL